MPIRRELAEFGSDKARRPYAFSADVRIGKSSVGPYAVLSDGVFIGDDCEIKHSVLLPGARIASGCRLEHAVVGAGVSVPPGSELCGTTENAAAVAR